MAGAISWLDLICCFLYTFLCSVFNGEMVLIGWQKITLARRQGVVFTCVVIILGGAAASIYGALQDPIQNLRDGTYSLAVQHYSKAAKKGDQQAQTTMGNLYLLGLGVERDGFQAAQWYLKAALAGHVPAQINLGQLYMNGQGVPRDVSKAVGWFFLARKAGSERAEEHLDYITGTNSILPLMFETTIKKFDNLELVQGRFHSQGEAAFLLK